MVEETCETTLIQHKDKAKFFLLLVGSYKKPNRTNKSLHSKEHVLCLSVSSHTKKRKFPKREVKERPKLCLNSLLLDDVRLRRSTFFCILYERRSVKAVCVLQETFIRFFCFLKFIVCFLLFFYKLCNIFLCFATAT